MKLEERGPDDEKKTMDRHSDDESIKTAKTDSMRNKPKFQTDDKDNDSDNDDSPLWFEHRFQSDCMESAECS